MEGEDNKMKKERVKVKVMKLRQLAAREFSLEYEPLRVFREIEKDQRCKAILRNSCYATEEEVRYYNEHIRNSKLSEEEKKALII